MPHGLLTPPYNPMSVLSPWLLQTPSSAVNSSGIYPHMLGEMPASPKMPMVPHAKYGSQTTVTQQMRVPSGSNAPSQRTISARNINHQVSPSVQQPINPLHSSDSPAYSKGPSNMSRTAGVVGVSDTRGGASAAQMKTCLSADTHGRLDVTNDKSDVLNIMPRPSLQFSVGHVLTAEIERLACEELMGTAEVCTVAECPTASDATSTATPGFFGPSTAATVSTMTPSGTETPMTKNDKQQIMIMSQRNEQSSVIRSAGQTIMDQSCGAHPASQMALLSESAFPDYEGVVTPVKIIPDSETENEQSFLDALSLFKDRWKLQGARPKTKRRRRSSQ